MKEENLQTKLIESLVEKKFNYWKEKFIKRLKECNESNFLERGQFNKEYFKKFIEELTGDLK